MAVKKVAVPSLGTIHLYKRRGVRGMRLSVTAGGVIRVSLPHWVPYASAVDFALQKQTWIESQQFHATPLKDGGRIGKAHHLMFVAEPNRRTIATRITTDGQIRVHHPAIMTHDHQDIQKAAQRAGIRALKSQAEGLLPQRLRHLAIQHGFTYQSVGVKQLKSRWGSCSDERHITLSCFLMQLPWHLIDYVLLHELVHTRIMAHGPAFWGELEHYEPNVRAFRKEIKAYRPILTTQ